MPRYDYECEKCKRRWDSFNHIVDRDTEMCCGQKASRILFSPTQTLDIFQPMVYTDICDTPLLISSKSQLREECKKHGVIAARLL